MKCLTKSVMSKPHWKEIYDNLERVGIKQLEQKNRQKLTGD